MMIETLAHYMSMYPLLVALAAWRALPLLVIAVLAGALLRKRLAPKYHAMLWSLVVLRALMPISVGSTWSVHAAIDRTANKMLEDTSPLQNLAVPEVRDIAPPSMFQVQDRYYYYEDLKPVDPQSFYPSPVAQPRQLKLQDVIFTLLLIAVATIAVGLILRSVIAHVRFARKLKRCKTIDDADLILLLNRECNAMGVSRFPKIKEVPELSTPAMFGLLHSTICLPTIFATTVSPQELQWIIRHELAHIRRCDTWIMTLAALAQSLHWINPLAWMTTAKLRVQVEAAADELAVGTASPSESLAYGRLLIRIAERSNMSRTSPALGLLPLASARHLRKRIARLADVQHDNRQWIGYSFAAALVMIVIATFTDELSSSQASHVSDFYAITDDNTSVVPSIDAIAAKVEAEPEVTHIKEYDVADALEKFPQTSSQRDSAIELLALCRLNYPSRDMKLEGNTLTADLTLDQHIALERVLKAWQENGPQQVSIEFRFIKTNLKAAASIDWYSNPIEGINVKGSQPVLATKINDDQMRSFMRTIQSNRDSNIVCAPKITMFNANTGSLFDGAKRIYVTGVKPAMGDLDIAFQPVVETKHIGLEATFSPTVKSNGYVDLMFDIQSTKLLEERLAKLPFPGSRHPAPTVQVPTFSTIAMKSTLELAPVETVLIAIPEIFKGDRSEDSEKMTIYAITPRILDL